MKKKPVSIASAVIAVAMASLAGSSGSPFALAAAQPSSSDRTYGDSAIADDEFIIDCLLALGPLDVDPIRFPGDPSEGHMHEFFGNRYTDHNSTPYILRHAEPEGEDDTATTCGWDVEGDAAPAKKNQSAYWIPTLYTSSSPGGPQTRVVPEHTRNYYRGAGIADLTSIEKFPANFSMIAGNPHAVAAQPHVVGWSCVNEGPEEGDYASIVLAVNAAGGTTTCPTTNGYNGKLRLRLDFPNCWDGNTNFPWSGDYDEANSTRRHMRYAWETNAGNQQAGSFDYVRETCPSEYDTVLPALRIGARWEVQNLDLRYAKLSSDHATQLSGISAHGDFMNGWNQTVLEKLIRCRIIDEGPPFCDDDDE